jgi:DUF4097 and DUF4098 domain-containing protein YvlB
VSVVERFHTPGPLTLRVRNTAGEVRLETADAASEETTVELEALRGDDVSLAAVEDARVELRERAGGHEVRVEIPERGSKSKLGFLFSRAPEVLVKISSPPGADVIAKTVSADVDARGRFGSVELETTSGDIEFSELDGDARIRSVSGDLRFDRIGRSAELQTVSGDVRVGQSAGAATVQSVSGDLHVSDAGGAVTLNSVSGDQHAENAGAGPVSAQSVSGDIRIGVRPGMRVWIDAASRSGDVSSQLDVRDGQVGEGAVAELRLQSLSGDIAIVRSAVTA